MYRLVVVGLLAACGRLEFHTADGSTDLPVDTTSSSFLTPLWSTCFGGLLGLGPMALAAAPDGRSFLTGYLNSDTSFGGGMLSTAGSDAYVVALDASGRHTWSRSFGGAGGGWRGPFAVAASADGGAFVTGGFDPSITFDAQAYTSTGGGDAFLARFDAAGNVTWVKHYSGAGYEDGSAVAADAAGNSYFGGGYNGTIDFGSGPLTPSDWSGMAVKVAPDGTTAWTLAFGRGWTNSLAVDASGNLLVGGSFSGTATFGATSLTDQGIEDAFVAKLSPDGSTIWARGFGSSARDSMSSVTSDAAGNVLIAGLYAGGLDLGCGVLPAIGPSDLFVAKLSPAGSCLWSRSFGNPTDGTKWPSLTVDGDGNVTVVIEFMGESDFAGEVVSVAGQPDVVAIGLDGDGNRRYVRRIGDASAPQRARGVSSDAAGYVFLHVEMGGTIDFGDGAKTALSDYGRYDTCLARMAP